MRITAGKGTEIPVSSFVEPQLLSHSGMVTIAIWLCRIATDGTDSVMFFARTINFIKCPGIIGLGGPFMLSGVRPFMLS